MKENLATLLTTQQAALKLTDKELAEALGYSNERLIAMIKAGTMNLPVNKVPALAKALQLDSFELLRTVLSETAPELWNAIESIAVPLGALHPTEVNLLRHLRVLRAGREASPIVFDGKGVIALIAVE
ncbi:hypothetical protein [Ramlibacter montanisoli]|uniref:HTH cro/C1-type domain-containing protein n=1 Tax=Ramlibacter montanisoli TaxID=2732512 RepID=A0A849K5B1_9BURK|nr:hypothetical protein [Ramlibacter montanisoli]NNU43578.1 hypothetical protein [Ramlibacter montanisoli]